jgi:hypothetical protein
MPAGRHVRQEEAANKLKYNSLCTEIKRMWYLNLMIMPVITEATGIAIKNLHKKLVAIPGTRILDRSTTQDSCM